MTYERIFGYNNNNNNNKEGIKCMLVDIYRAVRVI